MKKLFLSKFIFIAACVIGLSGCLTTDLPPFEGPARNFSIKNDPVFYTVQFEATKADLSADEQKAVQSFIQGYDSVKGEQISVSFRAGLNSDEASLAASQSQAVVKYLRGLGLNPGIAGDPPHIGDNQVAIIRMTPHLVLPECPDWKYPDGQSFGNTVYGNYNCANMYNLGAMVANPMDLVSPAAMTPGDGQGSVLGIQRYRADKVRELIEETPTTLNK